jgi:hypothetical protein
MMDKDSAFIANCHGEKIPCFRTSALAGVLPTVTTLTMAWIGALPATTSGFGNTLQVEAVGAPVQVNCTFPVKPPLGDSVKL